MVHRMERDFWVKILGFVTLTIVTNAKNSFERWSVRNYETGAIFFQATNKNGGEMITHPLSFQHMANMCKI